MDAEETVTDYEEEAPEWDWPIPFETVCDTPDALAAALAKLPARGKAAVIERDGKRVAAIIPYEDFALYEKLFWREEMRLDNEAADEALAEDGPRITIQELMAELGVVPER
ncbi:MAG: hypothetical protein WD557_07510 [Dehalococcoidia bacterium]